MVNTNIPVSEWTSKLGVPIGEKVKLFRKEVDNEGDKIYRY